MEGASEIPLYGLIRVARPELGPHEHAYYVVVRGPQLIEIINQDGCTQCTATPRGELEYDERPFLAKDYYLQRAAEDFQDKGNIYVRIIPPGKPLLERAQKLLTRLDRAKILHELASTGRDARPNGHFNHRASPEVPAGDRGLDSKDIDSILHILRSGTIEEQQAAARVIGEWTGVWAIEHLLRHLESTSEVRVKASCIEALGEIGGPVVTNLLVATARDVKKSTSERFTALEALLDLVTGSWEIRMMSGSPPEISEPHLKLMQPLLVEMSLRNDECSKFVRGILGEFKLGESS